MCFADLTSADKIKTTYKYFWRKWFFKGFEINALQVHFESFHRSCRNSYTRNRISINYLLTAISTTEITLTRALQVYVPLRKCNENFVDFFPPGKRRCPYPFCHAKRQSEYLRGWVGNIYLSWRFVWQSGSKEDMGFSKEKNIISKYKKLQRMDVCFPFHHGGYVGGTFTRWVFRFCLRNHTTEKGSATREKGSHITLLQFTICRKRKKKLRHTCIQFQEPCTNVLR